MFLLMQIIFLYLSVTKSKNIPDASIQNASETQHAVCNIFTKEIAASANATITRELKGVCTSHQLTTLVYDLQTKIMKELSAIKHLLKGNGFHPHESKQEAPDNEYEYPEDEVINNDLIESVNLKQGSTNTHYNKVNETIRQLNDSITETAEGEIFTYFWSVENLNAVLSKWDIYTASPKFIVLGHSLQIQLYPHHLGLKNIGIQLRPDSSSFIKKHKIIIINQLADDDISSDTLGTFALNTKMYIVPISKIILPEYTENNQLIIKVEIFLNS